MAEDEDALSEGTELVFHLVLAHKQRKRRIQAWTDAHGRRFPYATLTDSLRAMHEALHNGPDSGHTHDDERK